MNNKIKSVYLDNASTTRVDPEVLKEIEPYFCEKYGNYSSEYYELGRQSKIAVEKAREKVAKLLNATAKEIYFTSGATESNNWVIMSTALTKQKKHFITSSIEHHAVLETLEYAKKYLGITYTVLPVNENGRVDPLDLEKEITENTALVTIMHSNNEIGTIQPIKELAEIAHKKGALFHTDAVQSIGKVSVDIIKLGVDYLSISGHKFHGPKGIGALYMKKGSALPAFMHGGSQENNRRAGTINVAGAVGIGKAAELAEGLIVDGKRQKQLVEKLWQGLSGKIKKIRRNGDLENSIPNILSVCIEGAEGEAILGYLDMYGVQVSSGSACTSGSLEPSHVLLACGVPVPIAHGSLRMSLSNETTDEDIDHVISVMPEAVNRIRQMSATWKE